MKEALRKYILMTCVSLLLGACTAVASQSPGAGGQFRPPILQAATIDDEVLGRWSRSCALCHINGEAGAPVVGDTAEWQNRLQQGEEAILKNVVEGFNSMPPLGYCMACEISDFRAMISYMAGLNR